MTRLLRPFTISTPILALCLVAGCGPSAIDFNDALIGGEKKGSEALIEFDKAAHKAARSGQAADITATETAYKKFQDAVKEVREHTRSVKVPSAKGAQAFYDAYQKYLDAQDRHIQTEFAQIVQVVKDTKLTPAAREEQVQALFKKYEEAEKSELAAMQAAQKNFADANNISLQ